MNEEQRESGAQVTATGVAPSRSLAETIRPALIVSEKTFFEYSLFLKHLLAGFSDESIPTALICPPGCDVDSFVCGSIEVFRYPVIKLPLAKPYNRGVLIEQLTKFKPTILHCLCESSEGLTKQLAHHLDLPYIMMVDSLKSRWKRLSISRHCAKIIVPAKSIVDDMMKFYPHAAERTEQINIGTFVERDCVCFSRRSQLVSMVTVHPLDRVAYFENLFSAIRNIAINPPQMDEFMLIVIGQGRAEGQLRKLLAALDLLQRVTIVPAMRPWHSTLAAGDIFIQLQPNKAFNPFLLEAMSLGLAVAACKGGVDDLILADQTAVVFNQNDEISIRGTLKRLLDRKEFARQIARNAQHYLRENHSVSKMISSILRIYRESR